MKSQKGITLMSLIIYVVAFLMVTGIIGAVTTFFYSNYSYVDERTAVASQYNKLNLAISEESKKIDNKVFDYGSEIPGTKATVFALPDETLEYENQLDLLNDINMRCSGGNPGAGGIGFFDSYVLFTDGNFVGWRKKEKVIYYNQSVLCENVEKMIVNKSSMNNHDILNVLVQFDQKSYSTKYSF